MRNISDMPENEEAKHAPNEPDKSGDKDANHVEDAEDKTARRWATVESGNGS